ncbi:hypothetical protein PMAYCL1PPCAC_33492, partial [Pristionchus mayeri]
SAFSAAVAQLPADLPKFDFAALKKAMPTHAALIDSLQKQYEAVKIPYGEIPAEHNKEIDAWLAFNKERVELHEMKVADGIEEAKKVEAKWSSAPPVEHFDRQHFPSTSPAFLRSPLPEPRPRSLPNRPQRDRRAGEALLRLQGPQKSRQGRRPL